MQHQHHTVYVKSFEVYLISCFSWVTKIHEIFYIKQVTIHEIYSTLRKGNSNHQHPGHFQIATVGLHVWIVIS